MADAGDNQAVALEMTRSILAPVSRLHGALVGAEAAIAINEAEAAMHLMKAAMKALDEIIALGKRMERQDA